MMLPYYAQHFLILIESFHFFFDFVTVYTPLQTLHGPLQTSCLLRGDASWPNRCYLVAHSGPPPPHFYVKVVLIYVKID